MFDRLDYLKTLNCNAQYDWNARTTYDWLVNLGVGEALRDFGEKRCLRELNERVEVERQLTALRAKLIEQITAYQNSSKWMVLTRATLKQRLEQQLAEYAERDIFGMIDVHELMLERSIMPQSSENENLIGILDVKLGACISHFSSSLAIHSSVAMRLARLH